MSREKRRPYPGIADRIWQAAGLLGLMTRDALADAVGVNRGTIARTLQDNRCTEPLLRALATALRVAPEWLRGENALAEGSGGYTIRTCRAGGGNHWQTAGEEDEPLAIPGPARLFGFRIDGDSMEPLARHGQVVLALLGVPPRDGDLAYIQLDDDTATFKRVYVKEKAWLLCPVNTRHEPQEVPVERIRKALRVWGVKF